MKLYLEAETREEQKIKDYLEENASSMLAEKINNGVRIQKDGRTLLNKKTLAGFMKYAAEEAKKLAGKGAHAACVEDDVVYGWAIHYFEENSIEGTLYNEDGSEHKIPPKPAAKAPVVKPAPSKPQLSMFDLMGENRESVSTPSEEKPDDGEDDMSSDEEIQEIMAEISEEEKAEQQKPTGSPVYQKYLDVQDRYPQAVIAMRLGDFYEVFGRNAEVLANEVPLTLTSRDCGLESRVPMVGFPYHTAKMYFGKILSNGHTLLVMENDEVRELPSARGVDLETGEVLAGREDRSSDGPEDPDSSEGEDWDLSAFDKEVLALLGGMFGAEIIVR